MAVRAGCDTAVVGQPMPDRYGAEPVLDQDIKPAFKSPLSQRLTGLLAARGRADRVRHIEHLPARSGKSVPWPAWVHRDVVAALRSQGISRPWRHQVVAADHAHAGRSVVISTGTASGKSLAYLLPALTALREVADKPGPRQATVLYLSPTKALAADQLRVVQSVAVSGVRAATYDGDTPAEEREWARAYGTYLLSNPDMLHFSLLPNHHRWAPFLRALRYVVVDECHGYRGVFGSHVAAVLRRLRRLAQLNGADPVFILASATAAQPDESAARLTGVPVVAVEEDGSPRGRTEFVLWEPPLGPPRGEHGAPVRRSATVETAELLADLVSESVRTVAFVRSRRSAETVALLTRRQLAADLVPRVAAYRAGYLPHERRRLEAALHRGELLGVAATNALELGMDVSGLDAVVMSGWPGTRASLWQQAGRAGRAGQEALVVLIARDDPLDTYVVNHPESIFGRPVESIVLDPGNRHVLAPHLCAAAQEYPLSPADLEEFGRTAPNVAAELEQEHLLRRRGDRWFWTRRGRAADLTDIRGTGGPPVRLVEVGTGRLLGTLDAGTAFTTVHKGAVYVHQGETYLVDELDLEESVALVQPFSGDYTTTAREISDVRILSEDRGTRWGESRLCFGSVEVTSQVVGYLRRQIGSGEILGEVPLDLPARQLSTKAVWWTVTQRQLVRARINVFDVPGAAHAAEHASIGLLPLVATCDRWDIGGLSTALHPDTGLATVFVHDGHPGGAGFAERGYAAAAEWLTATRDAIRSCECADGCPSCVQSPKCGNGNQPLDKRGAVRLLSELLSRAPRG
jgi:DEAD/DEAH box helicase domain-containing protein